MMDTETSEFTEKALVREGDAVLIAFYKKNVKENISPTTGRRPDIQPL
jgi:hypothetical protein